MSNNGIHGDDAALHKERETLPGDEQSGQIPAVEVPLDGPKTSNSAPAVQPPDVDEIAAWNRQVKRRMTMRTRRTFLTGGAAALIAFGGWHWLMTRRDESGVPWPLRQALNVNGELARDFYKPTRLAPDLGSSVSRGKATLSTRINGDIGLDNPIDPASWRLSVAGLANHDEPVDLTLDAIKKLPRTEMTIEFKCIEGWSVVTQWAGARFSDFMAAYPPETQSGDALDLEDDPEDLPPYVEMATPGGDYYVGLDMESMLHPQTLLAYEMNNAPLTQEHGAPLRLVTPVKYGVKSIKRIGTISYGTSRPADYWAEQGYDWYAGL